MPAADLALGEAEYLRREAERAKAATARAWSQATAEIFHTVDPRAWTEAHPWYSLAGATVAGFVAAAIAVPSREQQVLKKLAKLEHSLNAATARPHRARDGDGRDQPRGALAVIGRSLMKALGPALSSALSAGLAAKAAQPPQPTAPAPPDAPSARWSETADDL